MIRKFLIFAFVANFILITSGQEQELQSPEIFTKDADKTLSEIFEKCQPMVEKVSDFFKVNLTGKIYILGELDDCEEKLGNISKIAQQYDLSQLVDSTTRQAILQLGNIETELKLGSHLIETRDALQGMSKEFEEQNIEYHDDDQLLSLKDIERIQVMIHSSSIDEMNYYWKMIADKVSSAAEGKFFGFVKTVRRMAKKFNVTPVEFWFPNYSASLMLELDEVMQQMKPFYEQLHGYIRYKIVRKYGAGVVKLDGPIPMHLYHRILALAWEEENIFFNDDLPAGELPNYNNIFTNSNHQPNAHEIIELAENFYESLGFERLSVDFWKENIIHSPDETEKCRTKVNDRFAANISLVYCNTDDFDEYAAAHEHLARLHSAILKKNLPSYFFNGDGLGEAFGRAVKLSSITPKHLKAIDLAKNFDFTENVKMNFNFRLAVETIFSLTEEYINARIVTDFLSGQVKRKYLNRHYWELWEKYAGVEPPIDRNEDSFDLPYSLIVKFMTNRNLIRDFTNSILAFQFYKGACDMAQHSGPLNECDFYNKKAVGASFKNILALGSSKPLDEIIGSILPQRKLDADGLLAYFDITNNWLKKYNEEHQVPIQWAPTTKQIFREVFRSERDALVFIKQASDRIYKHFDQINGDLFAEKNLGVEFDDTFGNMFWKISKSAVAASDLKDISLTAKKISASNFKDKSLKRALKNLARIGDLFVLGGDMEDFLYNKGQLFNTSVDRDILKYRTSTGEYVALYPDIRNVFLHSQDEEELKYYWLEWRKSNSAWARTLVLEMFKAFESAAKILEITLSEFWFKHYSTSFIDRMERTIRNLQPLYKSVHKYVKTRLVEKYGAQISSKPNGNGAIPDHLVEQVLLQIWTPDSIVEKDFPFKNLPPHEQLLQEKHFTSMDLLKKADEFYTSMGFAPLGEDFWNERLKSQPGSEMATNCHAVIFDMTPKTYMQYCDRVNYRKLLQAHGYMGRLHYAAEKSELPAYFFDSFFLEYPVGEAIILSASTPKHSKAVGLFDDFPINNEVLLNRQMRMAIHTLLNLHKYFVHTKVVAEYLNGDIGENEINKRYWKYMLNYAGIEPPENRNEDDFDFPYEFYTDLEQNHQVKKFVSEVLGYQMYEALCKISGHQGDLNNCDFYGSEVAGDALKNMMKLGSSVPRKVVLRALIPDMGVSGLPLLRYYEPLAAWFEQNDIPNDGSFSDTLRTYKG